MAAHASSPRPAVGTYTPSSLIKTVYSVMIVLGALLFALALYKDQTRAWNSYLVSYFYFITLGIGGLFFSAIQHVAKAGWSVVVRRFAESLTSFIPIAAVATIGVLIGAKDLYIWLDKDLVAHDKFLSGKAAYLNLTFFVIRLVIFFAAWIWFAKKIIGNSLAQDKDGADKWTLKNVPTSIAFLLVFALSYSLFAVDTLMSLQPHWYSTIWGVYCFAGMFQSTMAVMVIMTGFMIRKGLVRGWVSIDHLHDLAKFMKAFTIFYAYIAFSQFMLIWYANLPEETIYYLARSGGGWMAVTIGLFAFKFAVPFLLLLPRAAKRSIPHTTMVAILILIMQYIDIHWMVYPANPEFAAHWSISWYELGTFLMFGGLFLFSVTRFLSKNSLVATRDPRLEESLNHHVVY